MNLDGAGVAARARRISDRGSPPRAIAILLLALLSLPSVLHGVAYGSEPRLDPNATVCVSIVLRNRADPLTLGLLSAYGTVHTTLGRVITMRTTIRSLAPLRSLGQVAYLSTSRLFELSLDTTVPEVGAPDVWSELKDSAGRPIDGRDVIVGVIDTGIDPYHGDFYLENGSSKILFVWDQMGGQPSSHPLGMGVEFTRAEIEAHIAVTNDTEGHGTHVSAIAASTGGASGGQYKGVAPGAWLIVVKAGSRSSLCPELWLFNDTDLIDGIAYVLDKASSLGMRVVINLSLGSNIGGHDGTHPLELAMDEAVSRGAVVVVSAGNSAEDHIHAEGHFSVGRTVELKWNVPTRTKAFVADLWHSPQDAVDVTLVLPGGGIVPGPTGAEGTVTASGVVTIVAQETEKGRGYVVDVLAGQEWVTQGTYTLLINPLHIVSNGQWDAWVDDLSPDPYEITEFIPANGYSITGAKTVGVPGTSESVITVGVYSGVRFTKDNPAGYICSFSGRGPTRDGRTKPDLVAPGLFVVAAKSSAAQGLNPYRIDDYHVYLSGTSMSCPHVTGVVALLLQWNPSLSAPEVKDILRTSARLDDKTGQIDKSTGDLGWGWGKVDARLALSMVRVQVAVRGVPARVQVQLTVDDRNETSIAGHGAVTFYLGGGESHTVSVPTVIEQGWTRYVPQIHEVSFSSHTNVSFSFTTEYFLWIETEYGEANQSAWVPEGEAVDLAVRPTVIQIDNGTRLAFRAWNISTPVTVDRPLAVRAVWVEQFLLTVRTDVGSPVGQGWYDKGSKASVWIEPSVPGDGVLGLLGVRLVLRGWRTEEGAEIDPSNIDMDFPLVVIPLYETDYSTCVAFGAILLFAVGTAVFVMRMRTSHGESLPPRPPPPNPESRMGRWAHFAPSA